MLTPASNAQRHLPYQVSASELATVQPVLHPLQQRAKAWMAALVQEAPPSVPYADVLSMRQQVTDIVRERQELHGRIQSLSGTHFAQ